MECASCRNPNDPGRRYCRRCGLLLGVYCALCNFFNAANDDYCGGCGWDLRTLAGTATQPASRGTVAEPSPTLEPAPAVKEDEIETLFNQPPSVEATREAPSVISQTDIDSFFEKLSEKGDAEYRPPRPTEDAPRKNGD